MNINLVKMDVVDYIIQHRPDYFLHGCNCMSTMGAGVAARLAWAWPNIAKIDAEYMYSKENQYEEKLGQVSYAKATMSTIVCNMYTQIKPGPNFFPLAFYMATQKLINRGTRLHGHLNMQFKVAMVPIGMGLGGAIDSKHLITVANLITRSKVFNDQIDLVTLPDDNRFNNLNSKKS